MVQFKEYLNLRPFIITKPLIILFTILAIIFPWHFIQISGITYTNWHLFFFIFADVFLVSVSFNFLLIIKKGRIYRTLGIVGYYSSMINFFAYITYFGIIISLNRFYTSHFSFGFGFYFLIFVVGLITLEFFVKDKQFKNQSVKNETLQKEEPIIYDEKDQKLKSDKNKALLKKGFKSLSKTVAKVGVEAVGDHISEVTGDLIGDQLTELTGNKDIGNLVGKFAEKGFSTLSEKAIDMASEKLDQYASSKESSLEQINSKTLDISKTQQLESLRIDYKKALLGILKAKRQVQIEYIQSIFKIPREHIIGIIYEFIGEGIIDGVFNLDDTEFTVKI